MNLLIPPPIIGLLCGAGIWAVSAFGPVVEVRVPGQLYLAYAVMAAGLLIDAISIAVFIRARTTLSPLSPDKSHTLVIEGLYRFSRNPMYLGMLMILTGFALLQANLLAFLLLLLFVFYITRFQIKPEETHLLARFGASYEAYMKRVRRWL